MGRLNQAYGTGFLNSFLGPRRKECIFNARRDNFALEWCFYGLPVGVTDTGQHQIFVLFEQKYGSFVAFFGIENFDALPLLNGTLLLNKHVLALTGGQFRGQLSCFQHIFYVMGFLFFALL